LGHDIIEKIRAAGLMKEWQLLQTVPGIQERSTVPSGIYFALRAICC
jgi:hypothetical protein